MRRKYIINRTPGPSGLSVNNSAQADKLSVRAGRLSIRAVKLSIPSAVLCLMLLCACSAGIPGSSAAPSAVNTPDPGSVIITPVPHTGEESAPGTHDPLYTGGGAVNTAVNGPSDESAASGTPRPETLLDIDPELLYSRCAVLKDIDTGEILYSLSPDKRVYPASLTKIMTGLLAAELLPEGNYEITQESIDFADSNAASTAGFEPGEVTDKDAVLGGILMSSGAECSYTAAVNISGSEDAFAELMNVKARELGLFGTHFVNSTGLHDDDHYTTVNDLLKLTEAALRNPDFVRFFTLGTFKAFTEPARKYQLTLISTMFSTLENFDFGRVKVLGGKTGYTRQAGLCLVTYAEYNGHHYVLVTADNDGNKSTDRYHFIDAEYIYRVLQEAIR